MGYVLLSAAFKCLRNALLLMQCVYVCVLSTCTGYGHTVLKDLAFYGGFFLTHQLF